MSSATAPDLDPFRIESVTVDWQTWGPPLVVLSLGVAVGLGLAFTSGGKRAVDDARLARLEDLRAEKAALLEQIRSLDADRDKLGETEYAARRESLVAEAAGVLAELDRVEQASAEVMAVERAAAGGPEAPVRSPFAAGLWAAGVLLFFGVLAVFLTSSSTERAEGGSMTGGSEGRDAALAAEVETAQARLAEDANDLEALHVLTYNALLTRDLDNAMQYVDRARALDPDAPDLHVHLAILQIAVGMADRAESELDLAIAARPEWGRARLWLGLVRLYQDRPEDAVKEVETAIGLGLRADEQQFARQLLADARNPRPASTGAPAASGGTPPAAAGPMYAGKGGGPVQLAGTIAAPPDGFPPDRVVFLAVYRTAAGSAPPPPVATARLTVADLPFTFRFEEGHDMMGAGWPEQVWIGARIDTDGQPGRSSAEDLDANLLGPIAPGTEGLVLTFPSAESTP